MQNGPFEQQKQFSLQSTLNDCDFTLIATNLPLVSFFDTAEKNLSPAQYKPIRDCFQNLYSYPVQRETTEGEPTYFHHVAGTVSWELFHQKNINDADHITKTHQIYRMVKKSINTLNEMLNKNQPKTIQINIIQDAIKLLDAHKKLISSVLGKCPTYLLKLPKSILDSPFKSQTLSPNSKSCIQRNYPYNQNKTTPKKASYSDISTIQKLKTYQKPKRKLAFSSSSDSEGNEMHVELPNDTNNTTIDTSIYLLSKYCNFDFKVEEENDSQSSASSFDYDFSDDNYDIVLFSNPDSSKEYKGSYTKPEVQYDTRETKSTSTTSKNIF